MTLLLPVLIENNQVLSMTIQLMAKSLEGNVGLRVNIKTAFDLLVKIQSFLTICKNNK